MMNTPNYNLVRYELGLIDIGKAYSQFYKDLLTKYQHNTSILFDWFASLTEQQLWDIRLVRKSSHSESRDAFVLNTSGAFTVLSKGMNPRGTHITYWSYVLGYTLD